jgi:hypothetical protein
MGERINAKDLLNNAHLMKLARRGKIRLKWVLGKYAVGVAYGYIKWQHLIVWFRY